MLTLLLPLLLAALLAMLVTAGIALHAIWRSVPSTNADFVMF